MPVGSNYGNAAVSVEFVPRTDTSAGWNATNPVLASGEMGRDSDLNRIKFGNGTLRWNELPWATGDGRAGPRGLRGVAGSGLTDGDKGDIVVSASGTSMMIDAQAVTFAKIQNIANSTFLGRATAGPGSVEQLSAAQVKSALSLAKADVGLGNVDNTSDANKPVSTATQTALNLKLDDSQASAFGLSLIDDADAATARATLGLGTAALAASGDFAPIASVYTDEMVRDLVGATLVQGTNVTITVDDVANTITIAAAGGGGSGTVTSVLVTTANGISGSVATNTTTPAITLTLGAITPDSVVASGTVSGSNLSGTNTGDQTSVTGNAGTATALATGRTIALTGDVTYTSPAFDGTGNVTAAATIANDAVTNAKLANVATSTIKGRVTGGTGDVEDLTAAQAKSVLAITNADVSGLGTLATQNGTFSGTSSGTNTGDQTTIAGITGTKAQFNTAVTDGDILYVGDVTQYTDEMAQDALGAMVDGSLTYVDATPLLQRAALTGAITAAAGSNATALGSFTTAQLNSALSDNDVATGGGTATGTNTGDQTTITGNAGSATILQTGRTIALTGDVTYTSPSFDGSGNVTAAATIANDAVSNTKLANMATATFKGRVTAATGDPEDLTGTQATTLLDTFTSALKGLAPASGGGSTNFLRADGTWAAPSGGGSAVGGTATVTVLNNSMEHTETLAATGVTATSKIVCSLAAHLETDENATELLDIVALSGLPGTGTIEFVLAFSEPTSGPIKLNWSAV